MPRLPERRALAAGAALLLLLGPGALLGQRCALSPEVAFLMPGGAPWRMAPLPVSAELQQWGRRDVPVTRFATRFQAGAAGAPVALELRALRSFRAHLNGVAQGAGPSDPAQWRREARLDLSADVRAGANELVVEVWNARGPGLLAARLGGAGLREPPGDRAWQAAQDGRALGPAVAADDTRVNPASYAAPAAPRALRARADRLLLGAAAGLLCFLGGRRAGIGARAAGRLALGGAALGWLALLLPRFLEIPLDVGFDARHHLAYVDHLLRERSLPLATDGWSTFHPPLFHASVAGLVALAGAGSTAGASPLLLRALPFAAGLGSVAAAFLLARRLFAGEPRVALFATLFAAALPVGIYGAAYFSNEPLHGCLSGLSLVLATGLLAAERVRARDAAALGVLLALAVLTKFTALSVAGLAGLFLLARLALLERAAPRRAAALLAAFAVPLLLGAGWFYARNQVELGAPILPNWRFDAPGRVWWQQPGFHTPAYYLVFGQALVHPFFSGFTSFWDGLYSSFWADGFVAGRVNPAQRHPFWDYELMAAGTWPALPATALLAAGAGLWAREAWRSPEPRRAAALLLPLLCLYAVAWGFLLLSLEAPFYSQVKASYALGVAAPLALCFGLALARADAALAARGWTAARAAGAAWLGALLAACFLAYAG